MRAIHKKVATALINNPSVLLILGAMMVITTTACPTQQTWAAIWKQAGILADSYISLYAPNWANKDNFDKAWAAAYTDILNWKAGTPCADTVQAVNDAAGLLAQLPVLDKQSTALMAAIVVSVDGVSVFFATCAPSAPGAKALARSKFTPAVQAAAAQLKPPTSVKKLDKLWTDAGGKLP